MALNPRDSLLKQHKKILGYDHQGDQGELSDSETQEIHRVERLGLPELQFEPPKNYVPKWRWISVAGFVAALFVAVLFSRDFFENPQDTLRSKGSSKAWVYYERGGEAGRVTNKTQLINGDKLRVEVLAAEKFHAYMAIVNRDFKLLSTPFDVIHSHLSLEEGEMKAFAGSIELVESNEGETIVVLLCKNILMSPNLEQFLLKEQYLLRSGSMPDTCAMEFIKLR